MPKEDTQKPIASTIPIQFGLFMFYYSNGKSYRNSYFVHNLVLVFSYKIYRSLQN